MSWLKVGGITIAALVTVAPSAFAQTGTKSDDKKATQTFTGCLMSDRDYQRAHNIGSGSNGELVLVDVQVSPATGATVTAPASSTTTPSATPGKCADQGLAYRLRGSDATKLRGLVGQQVEVQGRYEHPDDVTTAGTEKPGSKLPPEVDVVSFRAAAPAAAAPIAEPAPTPPPQPPASTVQPAPAPPPPAPAPAELPHSASETALLALIGLVAVGSGVVLTVANRRMF